MEAAPLVLILGRELVPVKQLALILIPLQALEAVAPPAQGQFRVQFRHFQVQDPALVMPLVLVEVVVDS